MVLAKIHYQIRTLRTSKPPNTAVGDHEKSICGNVVVILKSPPKKSHLLSPVMFFLPKAGFGSAVPENPTIHELQQMEGSEKVLFAEM